MGSIQEGGIMASEHILMLSDADFEKEVINSDTPVLVDFFADWCGPCKMIAPYLEDLAKEFDGKVKIAKLDVDKNNASAAQYSVRSIPTLILFENGAQKEMIVGADAAKIREIVSNASQ
jgi:thioredoxin 1